METLIAVAHGSADPRAQAAIAELMTVTANRAAARGMNVTGLRAAYLGHARPSLGQVMGTLRPGDRVTVLPLLLTAAYHSKSDIPRVLARFPGLQVRYGATLGPHPLLLRALERRLRETGAPVAPRAETGVVLAAAGSSDPGASAAIARLAGQWQARGGWFAVRPAVASAACPAAASPATAVTGLLRDGARRVLVASYLIAPGRFADRIRDCSLAAGAAAAGAALGAAPEVADVLLDRYAEVCRSHAAAA